MSRESKIFNVDFGPIQDKVKHYESFGWELLSISGKQVSMTRETQNPVYNQLVAYEAKYEDLCNNLAYLRRQLVNLDFDMGKCLLLLIFFIFPGVLYIVYYFKKKIQNEVTMYNIEQTKKKIDEVIDESRTLFFSRQV